MDKDKILGITDKIILIFLTMQIFAVDFSIALSSISLGIWGGLWIIELAAFRKLGIPESVKSDLKYFNIFVLCFLIFEIISRVFAVFPDGALVGLKRYFLYMIFYASIIKIKDRGTFNNIVIVILSVMTIISAYEIVRFIIDLPAHMKTESLGEIRLDTFAYALTTGEIKMLVFIALFPLLFLKGKSFIPKKYLIPSLALILFSLYLTQSRNVFVALFVCFILVGVFINRKFLYAFIVTVILLYIFMPAQLRERITSIVDMKHPSNESRIVMWNTGWKMFLDHPFTGVGDNEITDVYKMYKKPEFHAEGSHLHSNYMMILATMGIFGMAAYIAMFGVLLVKHFKYYKKTIAVQDKYLIFGCFLAMIAFHISGIFEWNYGDWEVLTVLMFVIAIPFVIVNLNSLQPEEITE
ncbi:MAG: O-antigen ligase family protein [Ignavibacteria bacterium]|nr:O-antigen ligase family protein [Ignavibacteria bacterium]